MATEKRLIDANKPIKETESIINFRMCHNMPTEDYESFLNYLKKQPTVDAVEVVHGRWIDIYDGIYANPIYKCSVCGNSAPIEERYPVIGRMYTDWSFTNYCPNCGADMRGNGNG